MNILARVGRKALYSRLAGLSDARLTIRHDREVATFGTGGDLAATVTIRDPCFFTSVAFGGHVGAVESYVEGGWEVDDLTALVQILLRNRPVLDGLERGLAAFVQPVRGALHALNRNTLRGSRRNIRAHYDLGNELFAHFLDDTMTYSCGIFEAPDSSLRDASIAKYERICRKLSLGPSDHLVEIGSGWGGFAIHAASTRRCRVTTTTISEQQYRLALERIGKSGVADRITLLRKDYRELEGRFDKLASIEMIEAVGHQYFSSFFEQCARLLKPDGTAALQTIIIQDRYYESARREVDFIKRYLFPGSCLPSVSVLTAAAAATDLRLVDLEDITAHYGETLRRWRGRFHDNWSRIRTLGYSERFRRLWDFYLCYCEGGFNEAVLGDLQLVFAKPRARLPGLAPGASATAGTSRPVARRGTRTAPGTADVS